MQRTIRVIAATACAGLLACAADDMRAPATSSAAGKADDLDGEGLQYKSYRVLFTNPLCDSYEYDEPVETAGGDVLVEAKPKNVYCSYEDIDASGARESSPQHQLIEWIKPLQVGDEVFLAYLSYSNRAVAAELCAAAERGVDVTFVLDKDTDRSKELEECGGTVLLRGHEGGIGYAHNKILMINPNGGGSTDTEYMQMAFSSGNMSSGAVLHHENWHFIEVDRASYFAETHRCLMGAQLDDGASSSKANYRDYLNECRDEIPYEPESDIRAFFIPSSTDSYAATDALTEGIERAESISIAAHRFAYTTMMDALEARLYSDDSVRVRLVADDDLYWVSQGPPVGPNLEFEAENVEDLYVASAHDGRFEAKYMETNHGLHLLHHNKFLIFEGMDDRPDGVLCGAANLTGTGFWDNFENIYYVEVPEVVEAFKVQYGRFWDGEPGALDTQVPPQATAPEDMPAYDITL